MLFDGMVLFCTVVDEQGFSAAARVLGHTPSHVTKEIARLEARLGSRLLNRTTRKIGLTETGRIYYENARRFVSDARLVEDHIQTLGNRPFGELKISVPIIFAQGCFNEWLSEFMQKFPDVTLNIDVSDRRVDMISEGFDLLVRIGDLPDSDLISRELFRTALPTIAAPAYLAAHGTPASPHELSRHVLIDFSSRSAVNSWTFSGPDQKPITVDVSPGLRCNDAAMELTLCLAGTGITRLPELACGAALRHGKLVRILTDYETAPAGVHLIYPSRDHLPPKTRAMADFLVVKTKNFGVGGAG